MCAISPVASCLWLIHSHCSCGTRSTAPSLQVVGVPASEKVYKDLTSVEVAPSSMPCTAHRKVTPRQPIAEQPDVFELYPVT